jgi:hypothetical protein
MAHFLAEDSPSFVIVEVVIVCFIHVGSTTDKMTSTVRFSNEGAVQIRIVHILCELNDPLVYAGFCMPAGTCSRYAPACGLNAHISLRGRPGGRSKPVRGPLWRFRCSFTRSALSARCASV